MKLRIDLRRIADRLGWRGLVGIALLGLAGAYQAYAVIPLEVEMAALRAQADSLKAQTNASGSPHFDSRKSSADQLSAFYGFFPRPETTPEWLGKIHAAARTNGLTLQTGEYRLERRTDQKLARYQIILPLTGSYAQLRAFSAAVLAQVPAASIDEIQMRRESVSSTRLEARVRISLYLSH